MAELLFCFKWAGWSQTTEIKAKYLAVLTPTSKQRHISILFNTIKASQWDVLTADTPVFINIVTCAALSCTVAALYSDCSLFFSAVALVVWRVKDTLMMFSGVIFCTQEKQYIFFFTRLKNDVITTWETTHAFNNLTPCSAHQYSYQIEEKWWSKFFKMYSPHVLLSIYTYIISTKYI